jgi:hypothetical protein
MACYALMLCAVTKTGRFFSGDVNYSLLDGA